jgi:hypothetical protein
VVCPGLQAAPDAWVCDARGRLVTRLSSEQARRPDATTAQWMVGEGTTMRLAPGAYTVTARSDGRAQHARLLLER